jgi:REP element-mobilizing transposase RayT
VHLADSLPKSAIERIDQMIEALPDQERAVERRRRLHEWIDAGHGSCILRQPESARIVEGAFHHFDGERYRLFAWVVMPNHFHVLFQPIGDCSMAEIVASWKRYTATEIKKWLRARQESGDPGNAALPRGIVPDLTGARQESGDPGNAALPRGSISASKHVSRFLSGDFPIWPREYWDRYIRNKKHFNDVIAYIHENPVKAKLCQSPEQWCFSSACKL